MIACKFLTTCPFWMACVGILLLHHLSKCIKMSMMMHETIRQSFSPGPSSFCPCCRPSFTFSDNECKEFGKLTTRLRLNQSTEESKSESETKMRLTTPIPTDNQQQPTSPSCGMEPVAWRVSTILEPWYKIVQKCGCYSCSCPDLGLSPSHCFNFRSFSAISAVFWSRKSVSRLKDYRCSWLRWQQSFPVRCQDKGSCHVQVFCWSFVFG